MNKREYLKKLDELNLDKNRYCVISSGIMLLYGLRETTEDIDIKIRPDYANGYFNKGLVYKIMKGEQNFLLAIKNFDI